MTNARWYVSSPHKVGAFGAELPYGVQHAKEPGNTFTECGELAVNWSLFWDRPFHARLELVCRKCVNSVVQQEFGALPEQRTAVPVTEAQ